MAMPLSVVHGDKVATVQVSAQTLISTLKAVIASELSVPAEQQNLFFKGSELSDQQSVQQAGIQANDMLELRRKASGQTQNASGAVPTLTNIPPHIMANPAALQEHIKGHPALLTELLHTNPTMAEAILSPSTILLEAYLQQRANSQRRQEQANQQRIMQLNADPMNAEAQKKIEEEIRLKNVQQNMEQAMEYSPESFGRVSMLYIPMQCNGKDVVAFVDSGAQSTIMSVQCAERMGIMRLVDTRFAGYAKGVGTAKIIGKVHRARLTIGSEHYVSSFTILDNQGMEFLFGLDQLKRHQCSIDLKDNVLRIGDQAIPFLSEKDIPKSETSVFNEGGGEEKKEAPGSSNSASASSSSASTSSSSAAPTPMDASPSPAPAATATPNNPSGATSPATISETPVANPWAGLTGGDNTAATPAAQAPSAAAGAAPVPAAPAAPAFPESDIQVLCNLGFERGAVVRALGACGGNAEMAAALLFQSNGGLGF